MLPMLPIRCDLSRTLMLTPYSITILYFMSRLLKSKMIKESQDIKVKRWALECRLKFKDKILAHGFRYHTKPSQKNMYAHVACIDFYNCSFDNVPAMLST